MLLISLLLLLMPIFVYQPQSSENLALIARSLEVFGHRLAYVYDPQAQALKLDSTKRGLRRRVRISRGAWDKVEFVQVDDPLRFLADYPGRKYATALVPEAQTLYDWQPQESDLLLFGNEARGLPGEILALCDAALVIPGTGLTQSLNLAQSVAIVLYEWARPPEWQKINR
jgi:tRNA G18 (ribose-2'-O)-methylase SpoU